MRWVSLFIRGFFYAVAIGVMLPFTVLLGIRSDTPTVDDGVDLGYDDDDPGEDVDDEGQH
jgi:hypothetical protein